MLFGFDYQWLCLLKFWNNYTNFLIFNCREHLKVILISASNTWGLFLLVVLLGYGLIEVPRQLWQMGDRGSIITAFIIFLDSILQKIYLTIRFTPVPRKFSFHLKINNQRPESYPTVCCNFFNYVSAFRIPLE